MIGDEERLSRLRSVWRAAAPSEEELARAWHRQRAKGRGPRARSLGFELALGAAFGAFLVVAAQLVRMPEPPMEAQAPRATATTGPLPAPREVERAGNAEPAHRLPSAKLAAYSARIERGTEALPIQPFVPYVVGPAEQVVVWLGAQSETITGPAVLVFQLDPDRASGWRMLVSREAAGSAPDGAPGAGGGRANAAPRAGPAPSPRAGGGSEDTLQELLRRGRDGVPESPRRAAPPEPELEASWIEAAQALRENHAARAEAALGRLGQSDDVATRDSARLSLAQLWLSEGKRDAAEQILRELSTKGATPFVRRRAQELLPR